MALRRRRREAPGKSHILHIISLGATTLPDGPRIRRLVGPDSPWFRRMTPCITWVGPANGSHTVSLASGRNDERSAAVVEGRSRPRLSPGPPQSPEHAFAVSVRDVSLPYDVAHILVRGSGSDPHDARICHLRGTATGGGPRTFGSRKQWRPHPKVNNGINCTVRSTDDRSARWIQ